MLKIQLIVFPKLNKLDGTSNRCTYTYDAAMHVFSLDCVSINENHDKDMRALRPDLSISGSFSE